MAIYKTNDMKGVYPTPIVDSTGAIYEVLVKFNNSSTGDAVLASGDYIQLLQIPTNTVLTTFELFSDATFGTATFAGGIATNSTTATNATTLIAATTLTGTAQTPVAATRGAIVSWYNGITANQIAYPTVDQNILGVLVATATPNTSVNLWAVVRFRAARYGF